MAYTFDGSNKRINLSSGTTSISVRDIWSRWVDWLLLTDNSKYLPAFQNVGGDDIDLSAGTKIPIYVFLMNGWKIKPQEANHTLAVIDGILLVQGGGDPFVNTTGSYIVRINYQQPVQAISFSSGGSGGLTIEQATQLVEIYKLLGLQNGSPVEITKTGQTVDDIILGFTGDGENTLTIERV
jgi:hypothetical protein